MKKEVTIVPKGKTPLDTLEELGTRTAKAWIFIHSTDAHKLIHTGCGYEQYCNSFKLRWSETKRSIQISEDIGTWCRVLEFEASDEIKFNGYVGDPEEIFFLKMEE